MPWSGTDANACGCGVGTEVNPDDNSDKLPAQPVVSNIIKNDTKGLVVSAYPNPIATATTVRYRLDKASNISIAVYDSRGKQIAVLVNRKQDAGEYNVQWNASSNAKGMYFINTTIDGKLKQSIKVSKL